MPFYHHHKWRASPQINAAPLHWTVKLNLLFPGVVAGVAAYVGRFRAGKPELSMWSYPLVSQCDAKYSHQFISLVNYNCRFFFLFSSSSLSFFFALMLVSGVSLFKKFVLGLPYLYGGNFRIPWSRYLGIDNGTLSHGTSSSSSSSFSVHCVMSINQLFKTFSCSMYNFTCRSGIRKI
jgi:hypothetical protein